MYCVGIHPDETAYDWEIDATSGTEQSTVAVINNQTPAVAAEYQSNTRATVAARQSANPSTPQVSYYTTLSPLQHNPSIIFTKYAQRLGCLTDQYQWCVLFRDVPRFVAL